MSESERVIAYIAEVAGQIACQAGVGGMETAGSIVSYLAAHPEQIDGFFAGGSVLDWPVCWHEQGDLSWHAQNGKVVHPDFARRQRLINSLAKANP